MSPGKNSLALFSKNCKSAEPIVVGRNFAGGLLGVTGKTILVGQQLRAYIYPEEFYTRPTKQSDTFGVITDSSKGQCTISTDQLLQGDEGYNKTNKFSIK